MSWFKLDDRFFDNPKIAALSDSAIVAYLKSGTYCARELTDGFIPTNKAREYAGARAKIIKELVPTLWEPVPGGYSIHDYLKYNPPREKVLAEREAAQKRMFGVRSGERSPERRTEHGGRSSPVGTVAPVNPVSPSYPDPESPHPMTDDGKASALIAVWQERIGGLAKADETEFRRLAGQVPEDWFMEAIDETAEKAESAPWPFCRTVLNRSLEKKQSPRFKKAKALPALPPGSARAQFAARIGAVG